MANITNELAKEFSDQLRARRDELWSRISTELSPEGREQLRGLYGGTRDEGDESVSDLLADLGFATICAEATELADIEVALDRLNNHTFGTCADCGKDIALARLRAYPAAKRCLSCQQQREDTRGGKDPTPSL